jgi:hypothetical protein
LRQKNITHKSGRTRFFNAKRAAQDARRGRSRTAARLFCVFVVEYVERRPLNNGVALRVGHEADECEARAAEFGAVGETREQYVRRDEEVSVGERDVEALVGIAEGHEGEEAALETAQLLDGRDVFEKVVPDDLVRRAGA